MIQFVVDTEHPVIIPCEDANLDGLLHIPRAVSGLVVFAHGSGSSRLSPRNQYIARGLQNAKFATLLFDLLTAEEEAADAKTMTYRFDIDFLGARLQSALHWLLENPALHKLPVGLFGSSTGGGAALKVASQEKALVKAVVSRGGRPDLAGEHVLSQVQAPTLLIVGGNDTTVIELNEQAFKCLRCDKDLILVPGASHLFEEPGALAEVGKLAQSWFHRYMG